MLKKEILNINTSKRIEITLMLTFLFVISFASSYFINREIFTFQENRVLFIFSNDYYQKFTTRPGGLLEYAGNFITQVYFNYVIGSLILSLFLILLCVIFFEINKRLSTDKSSPLLFILLPACLLLLSQNSFNHYVHYTLGYLTATFYFLLSVFWEKKRFNFVFLALIPLVFYVIGFFALIYTGMYITYIIVNKKGLSKFLLPVLLFLYVFLTFAVFKEFLFLQPVNILLFNPLLVFDRTETPLFLFILIGYTILTPWFINIFFLFKLSIRYSGIILATIFLTFISITLFLFPKQNNTVLEELTRLEKSVYEQDWDAVIRQYKDFASPNLVGQYYYNLALANKDQLCERLFFANHSFGAESLTLPHKEEYLNSSMYFYYTIGLISEAHHLAYESMVKYGYRPETIKLLIKTNLINGNYRIAERYINVLYRTIHYKKWAEKYKKLLYKPTLINSDAELGKKISMIPKKDFFIRIDDVQNIELFLAASPDNRRAFEYKIARLLYEKNIETMIYEIKYMKGMGYTFIPRHIEEAILTYSKLYEQFPDLGGLTLSHESEMRFAQYNNTLNLYKNVNKSWLKIEMKDKWWNTFWFYYQFE
jgi:tetratricopeptide (TPR) repeat protein